MLDCRSLTNVQQSRDLTNVNSKYMNSTGSTAPRTEMKSIRARLETLGLTQYAEAFESSDVDFDVLPSLNEIDLEKLGVSLGHRKRMLKALAEIQTDASDVAPITGPIPATNVPLAKSPLAIEATTAEGERRQVTVLFSDMVGSTALSNRLDPEEYRRIMSRYHETAIAAIQRFDGYVQQIQGDGIVAYFGYPIAHEQEADRAIRAGLAIVAGLSGLDVGIGEPLRVRIGVASGLVVVSHILAPEKTAVGETPNLAQRMQTVANPGEVMVSERTKALAGGGFEYEDRGVHQLKGIAEPARVWHVIAESQAASRFEAATAGRVVPLVGRDQEIGLLMERWELARAGEGQVVLLNGEPGIGKSRMLRAFRERLGNQIVVTLQYQCSPYYNNTALYPIIDQFERVLQFQRDDTPDTKLDKLEARLIGELGRSKTDCNLIARALSIPCEERYGPLNMTPQRQKDDTLKVLTDVIADIARRHPTVVLFEDAHWADPTSIEILDLLIDKTQSLPLLVFITHRPEFQPAWASRAHVAPLALMRLSRAQSASLILRVANDKPLPQDLVGQIVEKTDGVPLFLEELTKAVLESDILIDKGDRYDYSGKVGHMAIPATLRDSLMARLDRLFPVKELAQIGAVIGREFGYELLAQVSPIKEPHLTECLEKLVASELIFRRGTPPEATYVFKHALVQDAAYDSLLRTKRQELHAQIAGAIVQYFPQWAETEPELLAYHYTAAGMSETAIPYWRRAGELALHRMALTEAIAHLEKGLNLCEPLAASTQRDAIALGIRSILGTAWMALKGWPAPEVRTSFHPAIALAKSLGRNDALLPILWGLWTNVMTQGRIAESPEWVEQMLDAANNSGDSDLLIVGHMAAMSTSFWLGDLLKARERGDQVLALYSQEQHGHLAGILNHDPKTHVGVYASHWTWILGYPDQAVKVSDAMYQHARRRAPPVRSRLGAHFRRWRVRPPL